MKKAVLALMVMALLASAGARATAAEMYEEGKHPVLDQCLALACGEMGELARTWNDESRALDLFDPELAASYTEENIARPYQVYAMMPTDEFDARYIFKNANVESDYLGEAGLAWQAIWNMNMINQTGESRPSVRYLAETLSRLDVADVPGLKNTCIIAFQLAEDSPCYVTALHPVREGSVLVYTTGIWLNSGSSMSNLEALNAVVRQKYGPEAFTYYDAAQYFQNNG